MSFSVVPSKDFRKALKQYQRAGNKNILAYAFEVIELLKVHDARALFVLSTRWRDHALKGDKEGIRELHLSADDLLLYRVYERTSTIELLDIVSHEELRKKW